MATELTAAEARELFRYDPETGNVHWRREIRNIREADAVAGHVMKGRSPHILVTIGRRHRILAHRLAWLIMTGSLPKKEIDHRNGNGLDNRWENLREASRAQNARNIGLKANNSSGFKGISFDNWTGRWVARIRIYKGPYKNLGRFDSRQEAADAYAVEARRLHGDFVRLA